MRTAIALTGLAASLACSLAPVSAHARARVFVASYGNDSNPCTFGSPCKTFQHAVDVVDFEGEVTAIDSAGFGPINITSSVTITSPPGVEAGIAAPAPGGAAITINTTTIGETITLSGLTLDGARVSNSTGISFKGSLGFLNVRDCVIRNFSQDGIDFSTVQGGYLSVSNTVVSDNGDAGIAYFPTNQIASASITLNRVEMRHNGLYGFFLWGALSTGQDYIVANVVESTVSGGQFGIYALTAPQHTSVDISLFHSVVTATNTATLFDTAALFADGGGGAGIADITVANSTVSGNVVDWKANSGGQVLSFGDNYFIGNHQTSGALPIVSPLTH